MQLTILIILLVVFVGVPLCLFIWLESVAKKPQHSIIRAHPYLGWVRYLLEKMGPEFRQYWFDHDNSGKPFSRTEFLGVVFSAKYRNDLISFGSKRDFEKPGYYIANELFPLLSEELRVDNQEKVHAMKYKIDHEGLFTRREHLAEEETPRWLYHDDDAIIVGPERETPWRLKGPFGASAISYGAVGEHYILSTGNGSRMAGGSWINTGEGGIAPEHLESNADVVAQIGPGLFGYRDEDGNFSIKEFKLKAQEKNVRAFELKFGQGAKIRGGHLEGSKVTTKVAAIRKVEAGKTINSPNRFPFLHNEMDTLKFIKTLQDTGGKPVGIKIVVGYHSSLDKFFEAMKRLQIFPDFITVDGGEGGTGATYQSMADTMGLPLIPGLIAVVDKAHQYGIREKLTIFASGKLISADKIAIALAIGADAVNSARGFMIANGCIMALQCHTGKCPAGITTTDPKYQDALVTDEKQWRVMNYIINVRQGLFALAAACGLDTPRKFAREHIVYNDAQGRVQRLSDLFPIPSEKTSNRELLEEKEDSKVG
ncbi:FMN-binding glutamate synthase family protein [Fredinandcohnia quinoae]|uniref:FMN-binding glutamate synthase family protein n=1 Tax=Fredinandcohnia quinoae TaxID=2918902 RepID=A0AAW5DUR4_9BACI|nr:FMN-binding glutamate synthase family protein [Fredinandcohnia sp. SECRCQ15]MCH1624083.1 FMN-binding glutamate synthase family protein [Fredinandcohnia sp. SECRCQ15]